MLPNTFQALLVEQNDTTQFGRRVAELAIAQLPAGDVVVRVHYSSLNYKDALSATGHPGVTKVFPHVPGVDAAGIVVTSADPQFQPGMAVLVNGFDLGMNTWGGFAEYIRVPAAWVVPLPQNLSLKDSMIYGTAGFTAALCIAALISQGVTVGDGEVLVTGGTGGVGSVAIAILTKLGYTVVAVTGKADQHDYLQALGATTILPRNMFVDTSEKPLLRGRWAGVVDTVGGQVLATVLKSTRYGGCVTACGVVGGNELNTTVYPFILRGVRLIGIDAVNCPIATRQQVWEKLATAWRPAMLENIATIVDLTQLSDQIDAMLQGHHWGRTVIGLGEP